MIGERSKSSPVVEPSRTRLVVTGLRRDGDSGIDPLRARLVPGEGITVEGGDAEQLVGHLEGWGWGGYPAGASPSFARSKGAPARRRLTWVVRGEGSVTLRAGAARVGSVSARVDVRPGPRVVLEFERS